MGWSGGGMMVAWEGVRQSACIDGHTRPVNLQHVHCTLNICILQNASTISFTTPIYKLHGFLSEPVHVLYYLLT